MPFPTASVLDDFNRADGSPGADWVTPALSGSNAATISSNKLIGHSGFNAYCAWVTPLSADFEVFAEPTGGIGGVETHRIYVVSDYTDTTPNGYYIQIYPDLVQLFRITEGATALLRNWFTTVADGDQVGIGRSGNNITIYVNGTADSGGAVTDSTYPGALYAVLFIDHSSRSFDDFGGNAVPAGYEVGRASETDSALPLSYTKSFSITAATETDTALPLVLLAGTVRTAQAGLVYLFGGSAVPAGVVIAIGPASETDTALPLDILRPIYLSITAAQETDTALPLQAMIEIVFALVPLSDDTMLLDILPPEDLVLVPLAPITGD